ncbi:MAG: hypothetical protein H6969_06695 [Gammaproteobacteria bacterium]|nr:hypothetical protein [Gammaproteobacteria bacterium]
MAWQSIATQTKAIVFLSTPHSGADLASWIKYIGGLLRTTVTVEELEAHHPRLRELNLWHRNYVADSNIKTVVYFAPQPVAGLRVVSETTADPGIAGVIPIPVPADHVSICKPASKDSQIYRRVRQVVTDIVTELRAPPDRSPATDIGKIKLDIYRRLGADWQNLADFFEIPPAERARFDKGWEPQRVWEWLEHRGELARLAEGLRYIGKRSRNP